MTDCGRVYSLQNLYNQTALLRLVAWWGACGIYRARLAELGVQIPSNTENMHSAVHESVRVESLLGCVAKFMACVPMKELEKFCVRSPKVLLQAVLRLHVHARHFAQP